VPHTAGLRVRGRAADPATSRTVGLVRHGRSAAVTHGRLRGDAHPV